MELVEAIFYKKINPGDLLNIDYALHQGGGGQTYLDLAGIPEDRLCRFLEYGTIIERANPPAGDLRQKFGIQAIAIGTTNSKLIEFDPRNNRPNYKLSDQRANRHPAWTEQSGFPHSPEGARYAHEVTNIQNLLIYIIRTSNRRYIAGFVNSATIPTTWPVGVGLESLFSGDRRGVKFLEQGIIAFNNDANLPFSIITTITNINPTTLPNDIMNQADDAVEFIDEDITVQLNTVTLQFSEHPAPVVQPLVNTEPRNTTRRGRHINQIRAQRNRTAIGRAGEQAVLEYETRRLTELGRPDLADRVEWISQTQGDGLGYDIRSFNLRQEIVVDLYIEVKTTTGAIVKPFEISINEINFAETNPASFVLFRIFEFNMNATEIRFYCVAGSVRENFNLEPTIFLAAPR